MKQGWEIKKLGEVCKICLGLTHTPKYINKGVPFISVKDISGGKLSFENTKRISVAEFDSMPDGAKPKKGDILFCRVGTIGLPQIVATDENFGIFVSVGFLRVYKELLYNEYARYWMLSNVFFKQVEKNVQGSTLKNLNTGWLRNFEISVPNLSEQERIVAILDSAFAKIDALQANAEQNLKNAKDLFQVSLKQELTPKQGWEPKQLNEICEVKDGTHDSPKYVNEGISFVTQKNITNNGFDIQDTRKITIADHEKFYKRSNVEFGDILISMIGANRGMACIVDVKDVFSIKNVGLIKNGDNVNQKFLLYYLQSPMSIKYVADASNGGAQEFVGLTALRAFPISLPPTKDEQLLIVEKLDALSERCRAMEENHKQTSALCNDLKQALLKKAFNGEL